MTGERRRLSWAIAARWLHPPLRPEQLLRPRMARRWTPANCLALYFAAPTWSALRCSGESEERLAAPLQLSVTDSPNNEVIPPLWRASMI